MVLKTARARKCLVGSNPTPSPPSVLVWSGQRETSCQIASVGVASGINREVRYSRQETCGIPLVDHDLLSPVTRGTLNLPCGKCC